MTFRISDKEVFKYKMLNWIKQFNIFCFLDNHDYTFQPHRHEWLAAAGAVTQINGDRNQFSEINGFAVKGEWCFGHISYEQGASWLGLENDRPDPTAFPPFFFFKPKHVLLLDDDVLTIQSEDPEVIYREILQASASERVSSRIEMEARLTKEEYVQLIQGLKAHIHRGDCYEINFCQEFYAEHAVIDPAQVWKDLSKASPNPFSAFYRVNDSYLICASPERFLFKQGEMVLSQPMKGTSARFEDKTQDESSRSQLALSEKDKAENVMVVDLVRNDLSRFCEDGTVKVDELFGVYSFPRVHQMVSTVEGQLQPNVYLEHIMRSSFPMGSMTGAPKKRVVELIREYEAGPRGIFSGTVGYVDPEGDFDWNVVIRSIMYNASSKYLSYQAGSGITFHSDPEKEWEECLLKVEAIKKVLTTGQHS